MDEIDSPESLVSMFINITLDRKKNTHNTEYANKLYMQRHSIFKKLREKGELEKLRPLLYHEELDVVMGACLYFFLIDPEETILRLEQLSKLSGIKGFAAENLIDQWKKNEISYDY